MMRDTRLYTICARWRALHRRSVLLVVLLLTPAVAGAQTDVESRLDELALGTRVRLALLNDETLEPFPFEVTVTGRDVVVRGTVQTQAQWSRVTAIVQRLRGVGTVSNEVELTDGDIPDPDVPLEAIEDDIDVDALDPMLQVELEADAEPVPVDDPTALPGTDAAPSAEPEETGGVVPRGFHRVEEGDTLYKLSQTYGTPIRDIRRMNNLSRAEALEPGRLLRVLPESETIGVQ